MKRRITAWVAALVLIVSLLPISAFAVDTPSLSVSDSVLKANDTFTVALEIPAIEKKASIASFKVTFDKDTFEVTEFVAPTLNGTGFPMASTVEEANAAGAFSCSNASSGNTIDLTAGVKVQATFKVKDTAVAGKYTFAVDKDFTKVTEIGDDDGVESELIDNLGILSIVVNVMGSTPSHTHVWDTAWNHDDNYHWYDCTAAGCDLTTNVGKKGYGAHVYDQENTDTKYLKDEATCTAPATYYKSCVCGVKGTETFTNGDALGHNWTEVVSDAALKTAATCTSAAVYYKTCSVCGEKGTETFTSGDALGHDFEEVAAKAATCTEPGNVAYRHCKTCDKNFDADGNEIKNITIPAKGHVSEDKYVWVNNETEHWKICPNCQGVMTIKVNHTWKNGICSECGYECKHTGGKETWETTATTHKQVWSCCGKVIVDEAKHSASGTGEATCVGSATCSVCNMNFGDKNPTNHASTLEHHDAVAATCVKEGSKEYWSCASCKKNFSNAAGTTAISDADLVVAKNPDKHTGTETWTQTADTHEKKYSCCGLVTVAETAHTWDANGVCTVCDYKCKHKQADQWYTNEDNTQHWQFCEICKTKRHEGAHSGGTATCRDKATCTTCSQPYGNVNSENHTGTLNWVEKDETTHEQKWSCCNTVVKTEKHTWNDNGVCSECGYVCTHTGGTATCKDKATCTICGEKYGDLAAHKLTKAAATAATCTVPGNIEYWTCSICEKLFSDENGTTVVKKADTVIPALGHEGGEWQSNETGHWMVCAREGCGEQFSKADHQTEAGTPNCIKTATCGVCGYEVAKIDSNNHKKIVKVEAKEPTCTEDGNIEYYQCTDCEAKFSDDKGENKIVNVVIAAHHTLTLTAAKAPTCLEPGNNAYYTCDVCGKVFKDANGTVATTVADETLAKLTNHATTITVVNADGHYTICSVCGTVIAKKAAHTFDTVEGSVRQECHDCHYVLGGAVIKPHTHELDDNKWILDETGHWHVCGDADCDYHTDAVAHDYGTETTVTEGNTTITVKKCQTCGYVKRTETTNTTPGGNTSGGGSKPSGRNDGKTVESGKTFDAGIGLYVGLSLLSLTGSAVVIGKKRKTR